MGKSALATFRVDESKWKRFQELAKDSGFSASALLVGFIDRSLDSGIEAPPEPKPTGIDANLDKYIESYLASNLDKLIDSHLENNLDGSIEEYLESNLDKRIEDSLEGMLDSRIESYLENNLDKRIEAVRGEIKKPAGVR